MINFNFKGKNFVLTGAGKGIGKSTLDKLYKAGSGIAVISSSKKDISAIKSKYNSNKVIGFCGDVTDKNDILNFFQVVKYKFKKIDGLVNNAGRRQRKKFEKIDESDLDYIIDNNLKSVFKLSQLFSNILINNKGSIVNISSIVGPRGFSDLSGYSMTKSGIIGLTKSLAVEFANRGIRVNSICPGFVKSSYSQKFKSKYPKLYKYTIQRTPLARWGNCDEVANLILFLLSNESSYITGNEIYIDGGWTSN